MNDIINNVLPCLFQRHTDTKLTFTFSHWSVSVPCVDVLAMYRSWPVLVAVAVGSNCLSLLLQLSGEEKLG